MKLNWGTGITTFIIAFMLFILFMVFKATQTKSDLYSEDYYNQEITYQSKINALNNAQKLKGALTVIQKEDTLVINYPSDFLDKEIVGKLNFFKPDNAALDKVYKISETNNVQTISKNDLVSGNYILKIECEVGETPYFFEQTLLVE